MKKLFLGFIFFMFFNYSQIQAQILREVINAAKPDKPFTGIQILKKKDLVFSLGIQVPNQMHELLTVGGILPTLGLQLSKSGIIPINASLEYFLSDNLSIGTTIQYASATEKYPAYSNSLFNTQAMTAKISGFSILGFTNYHFYTTDKIDPYFKGSLGLNIWKGSYNYDNGGQYQQFIAPTPVAYKTALGLRYFVSKTMAPYIELSYSNIKFTAGVGVTFKLNSNNTRVSKNNFSNLSALIFSAGLGTRFKPWTDNYPKALFKINNKTLLQRNVEYLLSFGIYKIIVNVHHFAEQIIDEVDKNKGWGAEVLISDERNKLLETGGGLFYAQNLFVPNTAFITLNADVLTNFNLTNLIHFYKKNNPLVCLQ